MDKETKRIVEGLITKAKLEEAFDYVLDNAMDKGLLRETRALKGQYNSLQTKIQQATISTEDARVTENRIIKNFLAILDPNYKPVEKENTSKPQKKLMYLLGVGAIIIMVAILTVITSDPSQNDPLQLALKQRMAELSRTLSNTSDQRLSSEYKAAFNDIDAFRRDSVDLVKSRKLHRAFLTLWVDAKKFGDANATGDKTISDIKSQVRYVLSLCNE